MEQEGGVDILTELFGPLLDVGTAREDDSEENDMAAESAFAVGDAVAVANVDDGGGIMMRKFCITIRYGFQTTRAKLDSRFDVPI